MLSGQILIIAEFENKAKKILTLANALNI